MKRPPIPCSVQGCDRQAVRLLGKKPGDTRGKQRIALTADVGPLCFKHYNRLLRRGDVNTVLPHPKGDAHVQWKGDEVFYYAVHARLNRRFGKASERTCVDCDRSAAHWSYDNQDPGEFYEESLNCYYSTDFERYAPRCVSCHSAYDLLFGREGKTRKPKEKKAPRQYGRKTCTVDRCENLVHGHGLCSKHYQAAMQAGDLDFPQCLTPGCERPVKARGLCRGCYQRIRRVAAREARQHPGAV